MSRTLTNLTPDLYTAVDIISRELVGFIPAVSSDMTHQRAAIGETVYSPISAAATASSISPGVTPPDDGDNVLSTTTLAITKAYRVPVRINGEQQRILNDSVGWSNVRTMEFAQAMRTLCNMIEADLAALYIKAGSAYGTAGTTPFGSSPALSDAANLQKILDDNGAPMGDRQLILNTAAAVNLGSLTQLTNVNQAGTPDLLRRGVLSDLFGFAIRKSAQIKTQTAGTTTLVTTTGYHATNSPTINRKGSTSISVATGATTGALALTAGDVIAIADVDGLYVVTDAVTEAASGTDTITIAAPGLLEDAPNSKAVTARAANHAANLAFSRSALYLATRAPAVPAEGDLATDSTIVTDPNSGLSFEVREYRQYRQIQYEVSIAWGVACVKPEHCAILLG